MARGPVERAGDISHKMRDALFGAGLARPIEGAAGSRYVEIPVRIAATLRDGSRESFSGHYVLRRSVVDGATAEQRAWRIYSAAIRRDQLNSITPPGRDTGPATPRTP